MAISVIAFIWRIINPDVFISFTGGSILYFMLIIYLVPIVTVIGWFGATLTFPLKGK
jgi:hypothetical protein